MLIITFCYYRKDTEKAARCGPAADISLVTAKIDYSLIERLYIYIYRFLGFSMVTSSTNCLLNTIYIVNWFPWSNLKVLPKIYY